MANKNIEVTIARGQRTNLGAAENVTTTWAKQIAYIMHAMETSESFAEYKAMPDLDQKALKKKNGWWMRAGVVKGQRTRNTIQNGRIITLDGDYFTPDALENLEAELMFRGAEHFYHTTRSHTELKPKVRVGILTNRDVTSDEFSLVCRLVAAREEIELFDKVSARVAQMMYRPTYSRTMKECYRSGIHEGRQLDVDEMLEWGEATYGDLTDRKNWPLFPGEQTPRESADKAEDPWQKEGPIGDFCRAWTMTALIEDPNSPIAGKYEVTQSEQGAVTRATYTEGTSADGATFYDDRFMYSHHGSDPCQEQLVNAFDMVRLHLFGDEDSKADFDAPITERKSYKSMMEHVRSDKPTQDIRRNERFDIDAMLNEAGIEESDAWQPAADAEGSESDDGEDEDDDPIGDVSRVSRPDTSDDLVPPIVRRTLPSPGENWVNRLLTFGGPQNQSIQNTAHNLAAILQSDKRFRNKIAFNEFSQEIVVTDTIRSGVAMVDDIKCDDAHHGARWEDYHDSFMQVVLSAALPTDGGTGYGLNASDAALRDGLVATAKRRPIHPLKEMIYEAHMNHPDEGHDYLAEFPIKYLGTDDNIYYRTIFKTFMTAAVARLYEPGCPMDYMLVLHGPQGMGKSSLVKLLGGGDDFSGDLETDLSDVQKSVEAMQGNWIMEIAELASMKKGEIEHTKSFLTRRKEQARMAYARRVVEFKRQTVFMGTTNVGKPLNDPTGNRRFWMCHCTTPFLDWPAVEEVIPKMWAQAVREYFSRRKAQPKGVLEFGLRGEALTISQKLAEEARETAIWEAWANTIEEWFNKPVKRMELVAEFKDIGSLAILDDGDPPTIWKREWGDPHELVLRVFADRETIRKKGLDMFGKVSTHNLQQRDFEAMMDTMVDRGWAVTSTRKVTESMEEAGTIRSPRFGGTYLGKGTHRSGLLRPGPTDTYRDLCVPVPEDDDDFI